MSRTVGEQVKTGFRLAGGILSFCASLFLLAYGLDAVWSDGHFVSSAWLGWVELSLAAVLIPLTMHLWMQFFAGCVGFGFPQDCCGRYCWPRLVSAALGFLPAGSGRDGLVLRCHVRLAGKVC